MTKGSAPLQARLHAAVWAGLGKPSAFGSLQTDGWGRLTLALHPPLCVYVCVCVSVGTIGQRLLLQWADM